MKIIVSKINLKNKKITFRVNKEEKKVVEQLKEQLNAKSLSEAIRIVIMKAVGDDDD